MMIIIFWEIIIIKHSFVHFNCFLVDEKKKYLLGFDFIVKVILSRDYRSQAFKFWNFFDGFVRYFYNMKTVQMNY
jgi:hypothetical protein